MTTSLRDPFSEREWWHEVRTVEFIQIVLLCSCWWVASVLVIVLLKILVSDIQIDFPYPFAVSGFMNIVVCALGYMWRGIEIRRKEIKGGVRLRLLSFPIAAIGLIQGLELSASNKVLQLITITDRQMMSALNPLIMLAMAICLRLEVFSYPLLGTMTLICIGGMMSNQHLAQSFSFVVILIAIIGGILSAFRWACTQTLLQRGRYTSSMELVALVSPYTATCCLLLSFYMESSLYSFSASPTPSPETVYGWNRKFLIGVLLSVVSTSVFALMACEFQLVKSTSALAMSVFQSVHNCFIILSGIILFGDTVTQLRSFGYLLSQFGVLSYVIQRSSRSKDEPQEWLLGGKKQPSEESIESMRETV